MFSRITQSRAPTKRLTGVELRVERLHQALRQRRHRGHLGEARHGVTDPRTTVLLVGYQAFGTRGRSLQDGTKTLRIFGEDVSVRARVETVHGLSAHADADALLAWLGTATGRPRVFVVHGDARPAATLAERIRRQLNWEAVVPAYRDRAVLA